MLNLIYARSINGVIGKDGGIPWHLKEDLQRFRTLTEGCSVIMGRKTYESLGKPLKGRQNIVLTRNKTYEIEGIPDPEGLGNCVTNTDGESLLELARCKNTFIIGGAPIYKMFQYKCINIFETVIMEHFDGDTHFCVDYYDLTLFHTETYYSEKEGFYYQFNRWFRLPDR